jgi:hypothetical protein
MTLGFLGHDQHVFAAILSIALCQAGVRGSRMVVNYGLSSGFR